MLWRRVPRVRRPAYAARGSDPMNVLFGIAMLLRLLALLWSLLLLARMRDVRTGALSALLALLSFEAVSWLSGQLPPVARASQLSEFVISVSALFTVYYVDRLLGAELRSKQALEASEAHFRSLVENAIDIVAVLDSAGRFMYLSPSVERVLGYTPDELVGRISLELVLDVDRAGVA